MWNISSCLPSRHFLAALWLVNHVAISGQWTVNKRLILIDAQTEIERGWVSGPTEIQTDLSWLKNPCQFHTIILFFYCDSWLWMKRLKEYVIYFGIRLKILCWTCHSLGVEIWHIEQVSSGRVCVNQVWFPSTVVSRGLFPSEITGCTPSWGYIPKCVWYFFLFLFFVILWQGKLSTLCLSDC